jgi:hypothetical protein
MYMRKLIAIGIVLLFSSCLHAGDRGTQTPSIEAGNAIIASSCPSGSFTTFNTEYFTIIHQAQTNDIVKIADLLNRSYEQFHVVFSDIGFAVDTPKEKLTWLCFDDYSRFNDYAMKADKTDLSRLNSYYSTKTNIVAMVKPDRIPDISGQSSSRGTELGGDILAIDTAPESQKEADAVMVVHEAAHQFAFNSGIQQRGVMYPFWASEGLATTFETAFSGSCDAIRSGRLIEMRKHHRLCKLSEFVTITRLPADADAQKDYYAQAWGFFRFLSEHHKTELVKYFAGLYKLQKGPRGKAALCSEFAGAFGSVAKIDKSWLDFVDRLSTVKQ